MGKPKYVAYPQILDPSQRTGAIGGLYGQGLEFLNQGADYFTEGAQRFIQPSFDTAFDIMQPFSEQIGPFTQASMREIQRLLPERLAQQEQLFQRQGAFFTPDLQKAQQSIFSEVGQTQEDFLTKLMFGLTEQGVGLGQNLISQNLQGSQLGLQASQLGGTWLDALLQQQFGTERANVNLENTKIAQDLTKKAQGNAAQRFGSKFFDPLGMGYGDAMFGIDSSASYSPYTYDGSGSGFGSGSGYDFGSLLQKAAPFANFIPGVGPALSAGLSIGGDILSSGGQQSFQDYFSNMMATNAVQEQLGGGYGSPIMTSAGQGWREY